MISQVAAQSQYHLRERVGLTLKQCDSVTPID